MIVFAGNFVDADFPVLQDQLVVGRAYVKTPIYVGILPDHCRGGLDKITAFFEIIKSGGGKVADGALLRCLNHQSRWGHPNEGPAWVDGFKDEDSAIQIAFPEGLDCVADPCGDDLVSVDDDQRGIRRNTVDCEEDGAGCSACRIGNFNDGGPGV